MQTIYDWATAHQIPAVAVHRLLQLLGMGFYSPEGDGTVAGMSEAAVQNIVRLESAKNGTILWRNNVGELVDANGGRVRYGLCNDSKKLNKSIKSADLIGIEPVLILEKHLGTTIGRFVSIECKAPGWRYNPNDAHQVAQAQWLKIITSKGGRAAFSSGHVCEYDNPTDGQIQRALAGYKAPFK